MYRTSWNAAGPVLLFRRARWYRLRDYQIPESTAVEWRTTAKADGAYSLDQLTEMARMNREQIKKLARYAGPPAHTNCIKLPSSSLLLFYGSLSEEQRQRVRTATLSADQLTLRQQPLLSQAIARLPAESGAAGRVIRSLEIRDTGLRNSVAVFVFRDGYRYSLPIDRTAAPMGDPRTTGRARGE